MLRYQIRDTFCVTVWYLCYGPVLTRDVEWSFGDDGSKTRIKVYFGDIETFMIPWPWLRKHVMGWDLIRKCLNKVFVLGFYILLEYLFRVLNCWIYMCWAISEWRVNISWNVCLCTYC